MKWPEFFFALAALAAKKSKDRSTKIGAVVVGPDNEVRSLGYNGFPRGINDDVEERHRRPAKYLWSEHAERNAIYNAVRAGICLRGCTMYVHSHPCVDCARAIIQSGITKIYCRLPDKNIGEASWRDTLDVAREMLREAGVELECEGPRRDERDEPECDHEWVPAGCCGKVCAKCGGAA